MKHERTKGFVQLGLDVETIIRSAYPGVGFRRTECNWTLVLNPTCASNAETRPKIKAQSIGYNKKTGSQTPGFKLKITNINRKKS